MPMLAERLGRVAGKSTFEALWPRLVSLARKNLERLLSIPSEIAIRVLYSALLANFCEPIGEELNRSRNASALHSLGSQGAAIVRELGDRGISCSSLDGLGIENSDQMFAAAKALSARLSEQSCSRAESSKAILHASAEDLLAFPDIIRWGLNDRLLDHVEAYLGGPCAYDGLEFYYSKADGREVSTRVWHRDREDTRMLKIAVYVNDVDEDGGPFQIVDPDFQKVVDSQLSWRYAAIRDQRLQAMARRHDDAGKPTQRSLTGPAGTVFLVDPARCHHRGKPPTRRDRTALFFCYFSRIPKHPYFCERSVLSRDQMSAIAATLPDRQRDAMLWRERLPRRSLLIPKSRLRV